MLYLATVSVSVPFEPIQLNGNLGPPALLSVSVRMFRGDASRQPLSDCAISEESPAPETSGQAAQYHQAKDDLGDSTPPLAHARDDTQFNPLNDLQQPAK